jgi:hypothetical protein
MIRDYDKVIDGLKALSEAPHTTRGQAELLKGAVLVILELQKDLRASEWLVGKLKDARSVEISDASEADFASKPEGRKMVQDAPKKAGRPKKLATGSETPEIGQ